MKKVSKQVAKKVSGGHPIVIDF